MKTYSLNQSVRQLVALLQSSPIDDVVVCPGSRNAPIVHSLANSTLRCHAVTDERSAAFVAIGISDATCKPVALCVTSGSALLNTIAAVSEAYYRHVPLLVISADRPNKWIGQMDGQTTVQPNVFGTLATTINLSEAPEDTWSRNREINKALTMLGKGPVHINLPLDEPLFNFDNTPLPIERQIVTENQHIFQLSAIAINEWRQALRPLIIVGQTSPNDALQHALKTIAESQTCVVVAEHLANIQSSKIVTHADQILAQDIAPEMLPDMVIYLGGHIVSKRLKLLLRQHKPLIYWHITTDDIYADLFQCLTRRVLCSEVEFALALGHEVERHDAIDTFILRSRKNFAQQWQHRNDELRTPVSDDWNELNAVGTALKNLSDNSNLALANSSTVRLAQHFALPENTRVYCNRGINGIEGSLSQAVGVAIAQPERQTLCIIGDLSFFYDMNVLSIKHLPPRLTILLLNNAGGAIFKNLPGLERSEHAETLIAGANKLSAQGWSRDCQCEYLSVENIAELKVALKKESKKTRVIEAKF